MSIAIDHASNISVTSDSTFFFLLLINTLCLGEIWLADIFLQGGLV